MRPPTAPLPILEKRAEIEASLRSHQVVVVFGQTGSGKTTQLPQMCLEMGLGERPGDTAPELIGHTQPRRLAARSVAARIAEERGERLGATVGVKVRFSDQTSARTRIKVMTDGILLAELASDPELREYGVIIIDEAHERSLNIDFLLGYLKLLLPRRPDLKVIVTSATIDPRRFSDFFAGAGGGGAPPVIEVSGRMYPVEVRYLATRADEEEFDRVEFEAVADSVEELCGPGRQGDILVFLPGERDIRLAGDAIARRRVDAEVLPLFSRLTDQQQDRIFHPPTGGRQRVILSTNIAETSLTVPGIRYVVDTGLARQSRYDPARKIQRLPIEPTSRASAEQRAGRCGRVAAGVCVRLYSEESYRARPAFTDPEIRRTSLASVILKMLALGAGQADASDDDDGRNRPLRASVGGAVLPPVEEFPFLDKPDAAAVRDGYETLFELGAITEAGPSGRLTETGQRMARLPVDPRVARMMLGAEREGALNEVLILAAVLSIQDPRERPMSRHEEADRAQAVFRSDRSDFLTLLRLWDQYRHAAETMRGGELVAWCRQHFLSPARMREWGEMLGQLRDIADEIGLPRGRGERAKEDAIHRGLLTGLISNVACREGDGSFDYRGVRGNAVQIFPGSVLFKSGPKWIMAAEVVQTTRLYARTVARIDPAWVEELAGHMFRRQFSDNHLDAQTGRPSAWERVSMSGIVVVPRRRTDLAAVDPKAARAVFVREALAGMRWKTNAEFMDHNRETLERARQVEARLRRRDLVAGEEQLAAWFESRVPEGIAEPESLERWRAEVERRDPRVLMLSLEDVVKPEARAALDPSAFPDEIEIGSTGGPTRRPIVYAMAPGKDEDGVTVTVDLLDLPQVSAERLEWLVPGMLLQLVLGLFKTLPKSVRASVEAKGRLEGIAEACAGAVHFGQGPLAAALSEAGDVLFGVTVSPDVWSFKSLPPHLRMRVRVVDSAGKELAADRDVAALRERLAGRWRKATAAAERASDDRTGMTGWEFGDLPDPVQTSDDGAGGPGERRFVALVDQGDTVALTKVATAREAVARTGLGLRRLFALACRDELAYSIDPLPGLHDMTKQFAQLGSPGELRSALAALAAERVFMEGQPPVRTRAAFEERLERGRGKLVMGLREAADAVASILEPRVRVAQRLSGGTPRVWAASVADLREHAAYLMPRGFLGLLPWARVRLYPRYARAMRERLFALREDGTRAEDESLATLLPLWKRFTGWVAAAMAAEREARAAEGEETRAAAGGRGKAALPQARRAAPTVNVDAGEWAAQPGRLPEAVETYRWALEDLRVGLFAPTAAAGQSITAHAVAQLWERAEPQKSGTTRPRR